MKNVYAILSICSNIRKVCEQAEELARGIQETEQNGLGVSGVYEGLLMDEVEHFQVLTLEATKLVADSFDEEEKTNTDEGSVFAPGELTAEKGEKPAEGEAEGGEQKE